MGNKCFKNKSSRRRHEDISNNSKAAQKKRGKYAVEGADDSGHANAAYAKESSQRGGGEFTDLATVHSDDSSQPRIHIPGANREQVTIELKNGPNHERPIDVPGVKFEKNELKTANSKDNQQRNGANKDPNSIANVRSNGANVNHVSGGVVDKSEVDNTQMDTPEYDSHQQKYSAVLQKNAALGFTNPALDDSDNECKSLSNASDIREKHETEALETKAKPIKDSYDTVGGVKLQEAVSNETDILRLREKHRRSSESSLSSSSSKEPNDSSALAHYDARLHNGLSNDPTVNSESELDTSRLDRQYDTSDIRLDEGSLLEEPQLQAVMRLKKYETDHRSPSTLSLKSSSSSSSLSDTRPLPVKEPQDKLEPFTAPQHTQSVPQSLDPDFDQTDQIDQQEGHDTHSKRFESVEEYVQNSGYAKEYPGEVTQFAERYQKDTEYAKEYPEESSQSAERYQKDTDYDNEYPEDGTPFAERYQQGTEYYNEYPEEGTQSDEKYQKDTEFEDTPPKDTESGRRYHRGDSPFGSLFPASHFKNHGQGIEVDREIEEIVMEIETIEDRLTSDLGSGKNAEELSRHIVEMLDELTALREQAEVLLTNDVISEVQLGDDMPLFEEPAQVIDWYNTMVDELNEGVGMALLELSMQENSDPADIYQQFQYHRDVQSDLLRKKSQLKRAISLIPSIHKEDDGFGIPREQSHDLFNQIYYQDDDNLVSLGGELPKADMGQEASIDLYGAESLINLVSLGGELPKADMGQEASMDLYGAESLMAMPEETTSLDTTDQDRMDEEIIPSLAERPQQSSQQYDDFLADDLTADNMVSTEATTNSAILENKPADTQHHTHRLHDDVLESLQFNEMSFNFKNTTEESRITKPEEGHIDADFTDSVPDANKSTAQQDLNPAEIDLNFSLEINENEKVKGKVSESSSNSEAETPVVGVHQFVTPYKHEDALWSKIESPIGSDTHMQHSSTSSSRKDSLEIPPTNVGKVRTESSSSESDSDEKTRQTTDLDTVMQSSKHESDVNTQKVQKTVVKAKRWSSSSSDDTTEDDTEKNEDAMDKEEGDNLDLLDERTQPTVVRGTMNYVSDSSDEEKEQESSQTAEVSEEDILPQRQKISASTFGRKVYDDDSDIEEKEVNYFVQDKPKTSVKQSGKIDSDSEGSDLSVDDIVNKAFDMEKEHSSSRSQVELFSEKLAQNIIEEGSSNAASLQNSPRDGVGISTDPDRVNFEMQTEATTTSDKDIQASVHKESHSVQSDATITTESYSSTSTGTYHITSTENQEKFDMFTRTEVKPVKHRYDDDDSDEDEGQVDNAEEASDEGEDRKQGSDDSDIENVHREYDLAMAQKPLKKARPVSSSENDSSDQDGKSEASSNEPNEEEDGELLDTLKGDIMGTMEEMTAADFGALMKVYRNERSAVRSHKEGERERHERSLWDILEERRRKTDKHIHDGEKEEDESKGAEGETRSDSEKQESGDDSDVREVEEGLMKAEELNQTIQLMDVEMVRQACTSRDVAVEILRSHIQLVEKMRRDKEETLAEHRARVLAKLKERANKTELSTSSSEDTCNEENTEMKDKVIAEEMEGMGEEVLDIIQSGPDMDEQELHELLIQYREEQQELIRKREYEKLRIQERLKERQKARKRRSKPKRHDSSSSDDEDAQKPSVAQADAAFYKRMMELHRAGELTEEELSAMIEEHVQETEAFKRRLRKQVAERRRAKGPTESMKLRMVDDLLEEKDQQAEQIRQLRQQERVKADQKLEQKIKQKKGEAYDDTPELPAPRRPERDQEHHTERTKVSSYDNYENVDINFGQMDMGMDSQEFDV